MGTALLRTHDASKTHPRLRHAKEDETVVKLSNPAKVFSCVLFEGVGRATRGVLLVVYRLRLWLFLHLEVFAQQPNVSVQNMAGHFFSFFVLPHILSY